MKPPSWGRVFLNFGAAVITAALYFVVVIVGTVLSNPRILTEADRNWANWMGAIVAVLLLMFAYFIVAAIVHTVRIIRAKRMHGDQRPVDDA